MNLENRLLSKNAGVFREISRIRLETSRSRSQLPDTRNVLRAEQETQTKRTGNAKSIYCGKGALTSVIPHLLQGGDACSFSSFVAYP